MSAMGRKLTLALLAVRSGEMAPQTSQEFAYHMPKKNLAADQDDDNGDS